MGACMLYVQLVLINSCCGPAASKPCGEAIGAQRILLMVQPDGHMGSDALFATLAMTDPYQDGRMSSVFWPPCYGTHDTVPMPVTAGGACSVCSVVCKHA